jgi:MFS family permease
LSRATEVRSERAPDEARRKTVERALLVSTVEGALHAVMLGTAESYLGAFAVELGHGPEALALLATVPLLVGAVSQLFCTPLALLVGGQKRLVVLAAALQALSAGGFMYVAAAEDRSLAALLSAKVLFWIAGSLTAPGWGAWMANLTARVSRTRYFALRSGVVHVALLAAFLGAGQLLEVSAEERMRAFFALFAVGLGARLASAVLLQVQAAPDTSDDRVPSFAELGSGLRASKWRVPAYLSLLMCGAHVAVPFFTPYMLTDLALDYRTFAWLSALSIFTKAVTFPFGHRFAAAFGLKGILASAGFLVAVVPAIWAATPSLAGLVVAHLLGGVAWALVEYSSFQLLIDASPARVRAEFLALSGALSGAAQLAGAAAGAYLLSRQLLTYREVFALSAVARAAPLVVLGAALPRWVVPTRLPRLYTRLLSVRPVAGASQRPLPTTDDAEEDEADDSATPSAR